MRLQTYGRFVPAACFVLLLPALSAQATKAADAKATSTLAVDAKLVVVPAVVHDKKSLVTSLSQNDFAITVDGKPQAIRYFDRDTDVPLTVGLLVDVSHSQNSVLDDEQKASQKFLDAFLKPAGSGHPADRAFVLQFAHTAELLQDVTDSRPLLAAGLKEIGTQAPGSADEDASTGTGSSSSPNSSGGSQPSNNGGYGNGGYGGYGRHGGSQGGGGNRGGSSSAGDRPRGGTVLYDALYLSSNDVLGKQSGRRALIVLTDGVDRHSKEGLREAIEAAQRNDAVVFAIYYKGQDRNDFSPMHRGYGGYDPYGRYPPTTGGSTDPGTYRDPDGKKILQRICNETGGEMFELKGKGSLDDIYKEIGDQLRAQYRLGFTPSYEAASTGYHPIELTLTNPADKKFEVQTREGYYTGAPKPQ